VARSLIFDATAPGFMEQWQRLDWQLVQNSNVHRYDTANEMDQTAVLLAELGYTVYRLDAGNWQHEKEMHAILAAKLNFPEYYGHNLDALNDSLRDVAEYRYGSDPSTTGTVFALAGYEPFTRRSPELAQAVLEIFAGNARHGLLVGHPMLCLISAMYDFPAVGATPVLLSLPPLEASP
jgi:hypothetical protein